MVFMRKKIQVLLFKILRVVLQKLIRHEQCQASYLHLFVCEGNHKHDIDEPLKDIGNTSSCWSRWRIAREHSKH